MSDRPSLERVCCSWPRSPHFVRCPTRPGTGRCGWRQECSGIACSSWGHSPPSADARTFSCGSGFTTILPGCFLRSWKARHVVSKRRPTAFPGISRISPRMRLRRFELRGCFPSDAGVCRSGSVCWPCWKTTCVHGTIQSECQEGHRIESTRATVGDAPRRGARHAGISRITTSTTGRAVAVMTGRIGQPSADFITTSGNTACLLRVEGRPRSGSAGAWGE